MELNQQLSHMQTLRDEQLAVLQQVQPELEHADVAMEQSDSSLGGNEGAGVPDMDTLALNMNMLHIDNEWVEDGTLRLLPLQTHFLFRDCDAQRRPPQVQRRDVPLSHRAPAADTQCAQELHAHLAQQHLRAALEHDPRDRHITALTRAHPLYL